ncbi:hypothetical protein QR680_004915 [Steinernema hermaphroditum]|uniref:Uncharacterized protein n=1 Tax=Steinernema hermaphroditum TaxID=289476 RepID=A0AA39HQ84_9BILA|nr:hypothetical protein QR680_004915 [Steinernema hermaphroditum]
MPFFEGDFVKYDFENNISRIVLFVSEGESILYPAPTYALFNRILNGFRYCNLVVGLLILYISFFRLKPSIVRSYAVFFLTPSLVCESYFLTVSALWEAIEDTEYRIPLGYRLLSRFLETHSEYHYLVLSNVIIGITFLIFNRPFLYQKHLVTTRCHSVFLVAWILVVLVSSFSLYFDTLSIDYNFLAFVTDSPWANLQYFRPSFHALCGISMSSLFVASVRALLKDARSRKRRRRLINVLVYCTPPNVFMFLGIAASILTVIYRAERRIEGNEHIVARVEIDQWNRFFLSMRYILASICILIAFNDYRSEAIRLWRHLCCSKSSQVKPLFTVTHKGTVADR